MHYFPCPQTTVTTLTYARGAEDLRATNIGARAQGKVMAIDGRTTASLLYTSQANKIPRVEVESKQTMR